MYLLAAGIGYDRDMRHLRTLVTAAIVSVTCAAGTTRAHAQASGEAIVRYRIAVPDAVLNDLKERLARTRLPSEIDNSGWDYGTNLAYLKELITYWRTTFNWREQ